MEDEEKSEIPICLQPILDENLQNYYKNDQFNIPINDKLKYTIRQFVAYSEEPNRPGMGSDEPEEEDMKKLLAKGLFSTFKEGQSNKFNPQYDKHKKNLEKQENNSKELEKPITKENEKPQMLFVEKNETKAKKVREVAEQTFYHKKIDMSDKGSDDGEKDGKEKHVNPFKFVNESTVDYKFVGFNLLNNIEIKVPIMRKNLNEKYSIQTVDLPKNQFSNFDESVSNNLSISFTASENSESIYHGGQEHSLLNVEGLGYSNKKHSRRSISNKKSKFGTRSIASSKQSSARKNNQAISSSAESNIHKILQPRLRSGRIKPRYKDNAKSLIKSKSEKKLPNKSEKKTLFTPMARENANFVQKEYFSAEKLDPLEFVKQQKTAIKENFLIKRCNYKINEGEKNQKNLEFFKIDFYYNF